MKSRISSEVSKKPKKRSELRTYLGFLYYGSLRKFFWIKNKSMFASEKIAEELPYSYYKHKTPLKRKLKDVDMWMQQNKITNLKLAAEKVNGTVLHPGEVFSYWKLIGKPSKRKGYLPGMILHNGKVQSGIGGGLCQLSNMIFWITVHTPLTVIERHRHGYDVFPDSGRTQPFASGATCAYPHIDLMIRNDTDDDYQLLIDVGEEYLFGEWKVSSKPKYRFEIIERNHEMRQEVWGGYTRHNELYQKVIHLNSNEESEHLLLKNSAVMMYSPFLPEHTQSSQE